MHVYSVTFFIQRIVLHVENLLYKRVILFIYHQREFDSNSLDFIHPSIKCIHPKGSILLLH